MKRIFSSLFTLGSLAFLLTACTTQSMKSFSEALGNRSFYTYDTYGDTVRKHFDFSSAPFTAIRTSDVCDVYYRPTEGVYRVEAVVDSTVLDDLVVESKDGVLTIRTKEGRISSKHYAEIFVYAPAVNRFQLSGTSDMQVQGKLAVENLSVLLSGTGDFVARNGITAQTALVKNSGTGDVSIFGLALSDQLQAYNSGTGDNHFIKVTATRIVHHNSGTGDDSFRGRVKSFQSVLSGTGDLDLSELYYDEKSVQNTGTGEVRYSDTND